MDLQRNKGVLAFVGARVLWDGELQSAKALLVSGSTVLGLIDDTALYADVEVISLDDGYLVPGFVDLQVNGGGGVLFNNAPTVETLRTMAAAHASLGTTAFLPTLITDSPETTRRAIAAVQTAISQGVEGILGLHLEGPHIAESRKGAHDGAFVRAMTEGDLAELLDAAQQLPVLKVTLAPENAPVSYVRRLTEAGVVVSLGHTNATYETCITYAQAGACCVTHLFNAQSQMSARDPGTVGAALSHGGLSAGLIADGIHVDPANIRIALRAKEGPGQVFLVSDAMATVGSDVTSFHLNSREILRADGRLTLVDGTLAGAHLSLAEAISCLVTQCGDTTELALRRATEFPARVIGNAHVGRLAADGPADLVHLDQEFRLKTVWKRGRIVS